MFQYQERGRGERGGRSTDSTPVNSQVVGTRGDESTLFVLTATL